MAYAKVLDIVNSSYLTSSGKSFFPYFRCVHFFFSVFLSNAVMNQFQEFISGILPPFNKSHTASENSAINAGKKTTM